MFFIVKEIEQLKDFDFWAGALAVAEKINSLDNAEACWEYLDETICEEGYFTEQEVNDYVWFYALDTLAEAGYLEEEDQQMRGAGRLPFFVGAGVRRKRRNFCVSYLRKKSRGFYENFMDKKILKNA